MKFFTSTILDILREIFQGCRIDFGGCSRRERKIGKELYSNSQIELVIVCVHNISFPFVFIRMAGRPFLDLEGGWQPVTRRKR